MLIFPDDGNLMAVCQYLAHVLPDGTGSGESVADWR